MRPTSTHVRPGIPAATAQVSLYWLILERLGQGVQVLMLPNEQLKNFKLTVILALVGQFMGLAQMLYEQLRCGGSVCAMINYTNACRWS